MNKAGNILAFLAGAAIGSVVTWKLIKKKYEQIANEEIESVKMEFAKQHGKSAKLAEKAQKLVDEVKEEMKADKKEYETMVKDFGYTSKSDDVKKQHVKNKDIYVIPPEIFADNDYEAISLIYYKDSVLSYGDGTIVEDVDGIVGRDSLEHFGEFEDDSVYVRNTKLETDYEILMDYRKYSDAYPNQIQSSTED